MTIKKLKQKIFRTQRRYAQRSRTQHTKETEFMSISWFSERIKEQYPAITIQPNG